MFEKPDWALYPIVGQNVEASAAPTTPDEAPAPEVVDLSQVVLAARAYLAQQSRRNFPPDPIQRVEVTERKY